MNIPLLFLTVADTVSEYLAYCFHPITRIENIKLFSYFLQYFLQAHDNGRRGVA
jgi:hypothetical protein